MLHLTAILGEADAPSLHDCLHALEHEGRVEWLDLAPADIGRRRLRATTDRGTDCAIALERDQRLADGAVLLLEPGRAIVVRVLADRWLGLVPADAAAALELGYAAGNLHLRVRFAAGVLRLALDRPESELLARFAPLIAAGRVRVEAEPP